MPEYILLFCLVIDMGIYFFIFTIVQHKSDIFLRKYSGTVGAKRILKIAVLKKKFIDSGPVLRLALEHYQKAQMAELADATDSKSVDLAVIRVRPPFWVLKNVRIISRAFFLWIESGSVCAQSRANPHFNLKPEIFIPRLLAPARFGALSA